MNEDKKEKIPFARDVDLAVTGRCNLRCKHCNTSDTWNLADELSFEDIIGVLDQLKELKIFNLFVYGGEPFFYPRIHDLLKALNDHPMRVSILTNGTLIDSKIAASLKKMKFLETVQVSIDGSTAEIHDWQRGRGSFEKSIEGIKILLAEGVPTRIKAVINSHNHTDIENMVELAGELGFRGMDFGDAVQCGRAAVYADDMSFEGRIHNGIMRKMFDIKVKYPGFGLGGTLAQKMEMLLDFYEKGPGRGERGTFSTCPAGNTMLSIRSDGKVVPCSVLWTLICGDIRKSSLSDIWEDSPVLRKIRDLADKPLADHCEECEKCDYLSYCNGGCRAAAYYANNGDLEGIDKANCLVFSDLYGSRVDKATVFNSMGVVA